MNIGEAQTVFRVLAFLSGDVDHAAEKTRRAVAKDVASLQDRAWTQLHAGPMRTIEQWDSLLTLVTFEEA